LPGKDFREDGRWGKPDKERGEANARSMQAAKTNKGEVPRAPSPDVSSKIARGFLEKKGPKVERWISLKKKRHEQRKTGGG